MNRTSLLYALIAALFVISQVSASSTPKFPQAVIDAMSTRTMRYHHFIWHNISNNWNKLDNSTKAAITKLGWAPPRPALSYDSEGNSYAIEDNNSGEDFFYMHRQMIATTNTIITKNKDPYGNITGWKTIPAANDTTYPLSGSYVIPNNTGLTETVDYDKSDSLFQSIKAIEKNVTNPAILRTMTLGQLGSHIEFTIHGWLHMRFSSVSAVGYRAKASATVPDVNVKWDNVSYNWLGDTYAAHVNPLFWKIHGWVDDRIEDWRKAHNLTEIKWNNTWVGGNMSLIPELIENTARTLVASNTTDNATMQHGDHASMDNMDADGSCLGNMDMSVLEEVMKILLTCGVEESHFYDNVVSKYAPHGSSFFTSKTHKTTVTVKKSLRGSSDQN